MKHLNPDVLSRLVDEPPSEDERRHLAACARCGEELRALQKQRRALAALREARPPAEAWDALSVRLREEGLMAQAPAPIHAARGARVRAAKQGPMPPVVGPLPRRRRPGAWLTAAAAVLLFTSGALVGAALRGGEQPPSAVDRAFLASEEVLPDAEDLSLGEAEELVTLAHQWHLDALLLYRDRLERADGAVSVADPVTRFVAIDHLLSATEAAVRENPADPFLNGVLVGAAAEREAALEGISFVSDVPRALP